MSYYYVTVKPYGAEEYMEVFRSVCEKSAQEMVDELTSWFNDNDFVVSNTKPKVHLIEEDPTLHHAYNRHLLRGFLDDPWPVDPAKPKFLVIDGGVS